MKQISSKLKIVTNVDFPAYIQYAVFSSSVKLQEFNVLEKVKRNQSTFSFAVTIYFQLSTYIYCPHEINCQNCYVSKDFLVLNFELEISHKSFRIFQKFVFSSHLDVIFQ